MLALLYFLRILTERKQIMTFPCADIKNPWPLSTDSFLLVS